MNVQLTKNFNLKEFEKSAKAVTLGIDNTAPESARVALYDLCVNVLQPVRDWCGAPVYISSGYRCPRLNRALTGASSKSQHMKGQAADFYIDTRKCKYSMLDVFKYIKTSLVFDQLIYETRAGGRCWIHVSYVSCRTNRRQSLRCDGFANYLY